jgi:phosphoglycolate phosphatase
MSLPVKAVLFDVDGVLLDSLPEHLRICRDKATEFGLKLTIPTVDEFRNLVVSGVKVSPMLYFFLAVGFPPELAQQADEDYRKDFAAKYPPKVFAGVDIMLGELRAAGLMLGMVTSNIKDNVEPALGKATEHFDKRCLFYFDRYPEPKSKAWCLSESARILKLPPAHCIYVGDQPADAAAASEAGAQFLGVTYGWGITKNDTRYQSVDGVSEIAQVLTKRHMAA